MTSEQSEYVLGTHDEERSRLGLQHSVWRPMMLDCWQRAGITVGSRVVDVGCGPGYATTDLSQVVGASGEVLAVESSERFCQSTRERCQKYGVENVVVESVDLMKQPIPVTGFDATWTRWVACFVSEPSRLVDSISNALRPGGVAIFHEYADYSSWKMLPQISIIEEFVCEVMESWRASGGEPDIARSLPTTLEERRFEIASVQPHVFCTHPRDFIWEWPISFIEINLNRLVALVASKRVGRRLYEEQFCRQVLTFGQEWMTPMVLEIIAVKKSSVSWCVPDGFRLALGRRVS